MELSTINDHDRNVKVAASCKPPSGVSDSCCVGSFSQGGAVRATMRHQCTVPMRQEFRAVEASANEFFQNNPLPQGEDMKCDMCRVVELARRHNLSIALIGDSMHSQVTEGLDCELQRRNYRVTTEVKGVYSRKHGASKIMHVQSPSWAPDTVVTIKFHMLYMAPLCEGCRNLPFLTAEADMVVMGFGLHWWYGPPRVQPDKGEDGYTKNMAEVYKLMKDQGHVKLLVHRETSAQHFDADGGEYSFWYVL